MEEVTQEEIERIAVDADVSRAVAARVLRAVHAERPHFQWQYTDRKAGPAMKAGSKIEFGDLEVGMKVRCERSTVEVITEGRITTLGGIGPQVVGFCLGDRHDTYTLLEDFNEPKLPEREGLVVASWSRDKDSFSPIAGDKVLGHWRQTADGGWAFRPVMTRSPFWIGPRRITAITEVTPVPDDALELLADLQRHMASPDEPSRLTEARAVLDGFFRRVNEVQG